MTERIITEEPVSKPAPDEEEKIAIGQKLGAIDRRYPNSRRLREAQITITLKIFEKLSKGSSRGNIVELEGILESIDFTQNRVVLEGRRIKLGEITEVTVPAGFDEEENFGGDSFPDDSFESIPDCWRNPTLGIRNERGYQAEYYADPDPEYYPDPDFGENDDSGWGFYPDTFPDYDAEPIMQKKESTAGKRKPKTILYTPKTGYRACRY